MYKLHKYYPSLTGESCIKNVFTHKEACDSCIDREVKRGNITLFLNGKCIHRSSTMSVQRALKIEKKLEEEKHLELDLEMT